MQYPISILLEDVKNFYQNYQKTTKSYFLPRQEHARRRYSRMEPEKIMTLIIIYHLSGYRNFKIFYEEFAQLYLKRYFPDLISYSWFIRLRMRYMHAMLCYLMSKLQSSHDVSYIDSTCLKACHIKRSSRHKTFKDIASIGHTSVGWFYGMKLHLAIDSQGNLVDFCLSKGNKADLNCLERLSRNIKGLLFADKRYISKQKTEILDKIGVKLITKVRKNMKMKKLSKTELALLRCRGVIETTIGQLKEMHHIENTKLRSVYGWIINLIGALIAYQIKPFKPSIKPVILSKSKLKQI